MQKYFKLNNGVDIPNIGFGTWRVPESEQCVESVLTALDCGYRHIDTAYFYNKKEVWKLIGNVKIENLNGERFNTELLYWDQKKEKIYSDKYIRIEQPDRVITGWGFESNQEMTIYKILKPGGIFYVEDNAVAESDSLSRN